MPYELTLRLDSPTPVNREEIKAELLSMGMQTAPSSGLITDGFALFDIIENLDITANVEIIASLPYGAPLEDVSKEFLLLIEIAELIEAKLLDDNKAIIVSDYDLSSKSGLADLLTPFCERYTQASKAAVKVFGSL